MRDLRQRIDSPLFQEQAPRQIQSDSAQKKISESSIHPRRERQTGFGLRQVHQSPGQENKIETSRRAGCFFINVGLPRIELGLHAPHACVLPVYYSPKNDALIFTTVPNQKQKSLSYDYPAEAKVGILNPRPRVKMLSVSPKNIFDPES